MNPQHDNQPVDTPVGPPPMWHQEPSTEPQPVTTTPEPKKSHKKLLLGIGLLVLILGIGIGIYVMYSLKNPEANSTKQSSIVVPNVDSTKTNNPELDAATDALTNSAVTEINYTSTDDSGAATDASNSTTNVGDSINENNL